MTRLTNRYTLCALAIVLICSMAPVAQARSLQSYIPLIGAAPASATASSTASTVPGMASQAAAPTANVYDASDAVPPEQTRILLALAAALALVGALILQERWLQATLEPMFPRRSSKRGARFEQPLNSSGNFGVGRNVPAQ